MLSEIEIIARLLLAAVLGTAVGYERETSDKPAGIRTHTIVSIGACLFTLVGLFIVETSTETAGTQIDTTRVVEGIITGIGFLGAGALFRSKDRISGLTTAAGIWAMGAIGLAVGFGYYFAAVFSTVLVYFVLFSGRLTGKESENEK